MAHVALLMFPAREGDCIVVEYGDPAAPERILIDGGRQATYRDHLRRYLAALTKAEQTLRLAVVTHIDRDHLEGCVDLLRDPESRIATRDVWFNDYRNLLSDEPPQSALSAAQGEALSLLISHRKWPRNVAFGGGAVSTGPQSEPRSVPLAPGVAVTLLGPDRWALERLEPVWQEECRKAGIKPGAVELGEKEPEPATMAGISVLTPEAMAMTPSEPDRARANGSSIAFLLECLGRRILFAADATPEALGAALRSLGHGPDNPLKVDVLKVPHHGSRRNMTNELARSIEAKKYLISTDGSLFGHPDCEGVARLVVASQRLKQLCFNYRSNANKIWDRDDWRTEYHYCTKYGNGSGPLRLGLEP